MSSDWSHKNTCQLVVCHGADYRFFFERAEANVLKLLNKNVIYALYVHFVLHIKSYAS